MRRLLLAVACLFLLNGCGAYIVTRCWTWCAGDQRCCLGGPRPEAVR